MNVTVSHASEKGRRPYQEDTYFCIPVKTGILIGIFDGHSGAEVSEYCKENVPAFWTLATEGNNYERRVQELFAILNQKTREFDAGSTASIAFIPESKTEVIVGVLGDSPVLVKQADGIVWVAPEHNVRSNKTEARAAENRGGFIQGGYLFERFSGDGLQMSRALGDSHLDRVLSRVPEIFTIPMNEKSFVLVASDGLFDPAHISNQASGIISAIENGSDAKSLVQTAIDTPTHDNVTAVLVRFSE